MLPRVVTSMTPLPCSCAAAQSLLECGKRDGADRPQPHQQSIAGRHRCRKAGTGAATERLIASTRPPRAKPRDRRRRRCVAGARSRAAARHRADRRSRPRPAGFRAAKTRSPWRPRHKPRAADRTIHSRPRRSSPRTRRDRSTVSASSAAPRGPCRIWPAIKTGLIARARTMRASAADSVRARGRCGSVTSSMIRSAARPSIFAAAAKPPTKAASSPPSRRSRPGSSLGCTRRSAPATRRANAPAAWLPSPAAPP